MPDKRKASEMDKSSEKPTSTSPFIPMFEHFRDELDEHYDRRERIIKASRDITASSKKIIFALQRVRQIPQPIPANITMSLTPHETIIRDRFRTVLPDLQGSNYHRYHRQITSGIQEWMEQEVFRHYLETQTLLTWDEAQEKLSAVVRGSKGEGEPQGEKMEVDAQEDRGEGKGTDMDLPLTYEDYVLGLFDATGEMMRFAITTIATSGALPTTAVSTPTTASTTTSTTTNPTSPNPNTTKAPRTVVQDLQTLRTVLSNLVYSSKFGGGRERDMESKLKVTLQSVEKVERALYGLRVRGSERPVGWMPDLEPGRDVEVEA